MNLSTPTTFATTINHYTNMSLYSLEGTIIHIGETEHIGEKLFPKRIFAIESKDREYTFQHALVLLKDNTSLIDKYEVGQKVQVRFATSSREWNGKWFTENKAVFIQDTSNHQPQEKTGTHSTPPPVPPPPPPKPPQEKDGYEQAEENEEKVPF